jgi:thiol:disulfide interchange protein
MRLHILFILLSFNVFLNNNTKANFTFEFGSTAESNGLLPQVYDPVKWNFKTIDNGNGEISLVLEAVIEEKWHIYSQTLPKDEGPIPTSFTFKPSKNYQLIGKTSEGKFKSEYDPNFEMVLNYFENKAIFTQKVKVLSDKPFKISGSLNFMTCDDQKCLPPTDVDFTFDVKGFIAETKIEETNPIPIVKKDSTDGSSIEKVDPINKTTSLPKATENKTQITNKNESSEARSWWSIFIEGFGWGLAALLTPCVFPMVPMNVSFFLKRSKNKREGLKNALIYAFFIIAIYVALGILISKIFGPDALNALSTDPYFNLFFFALLIVFAVSFLGAFEIVLPSSFVNKIDAQSDRGGIVGIFFMALALSVVSFSCTGPLIGTALVRSATSGAISGPAIIMAGFASGLAIPFGLFAFFPSMMNSLPKSGGWLNSVKVVLGFLELALALKFLSNADLVLQLGLLQRELFLVIWIVIFALMTIYLLGGIKFAHDSELKHISVTRLFFAILSLSFTVYLVPGLWGAPLKLIAGFPPPDFYAESPLGLGNNSATIAHNENNTAANKNEVHCPNNLPCFHDYDQALAYAKQVNKPLMIDFTGWACVNCRKMENQVWIDTRVDNILRNDVVLVSLYVDDKRELPLAEQTVKMLGEKEYRIKTIGNKWSYMQASIYKTNSQPQYILLDHQENMLLPDVSYDPDIEKYIKWLQEGIGKFNE